MRTIHQGHLPIRTLVLIGMVILITAQAYAQNANARLTITLRNAIFFYLKSRNQHQP